MPWGFAAAGVASGVAGAAANSAGGKKGSDESRQSSALSHEQATNARVQRQLGIQQFSATQGLRNDTIKNLGLAANGGIPSFLDLAPKVDSSLSAFTPTSHLATLSIPQIEYDHAQNKQALLRSGVRGGALTQVPMPYNSSNWATCHGWKASKPMTSCGSKGAMSNGRGSDKRCLGPPAIMAPGRWCNRNRAFPRPWRDSAMRPAT
jgi:hypothetical protein